MSLKSQVHSGAMDPKLAPDTGKGQPAAVEPDRFLDLRHRQRSKAHLDASSLEMLGDGLSIDAELCRQLIHGGARAVAIDQPSEFSLVEPLGPLRSPSRVSLRDP